MEPLQRSIPLSLKNMIISSKSLNLDSSCTALDVYFSKSPLFLKHVEQLIYPCQSSCAKDSSFALNSKLEGNAALKVLNYERALFSYTKALRYAPFTSKEEDRLFLATVFVNRAATLHKLKLFEPALRDCGRAIDVNASYSKAWFRRSRIKYDMREFEGSLSDMKEALAHEKTSTGQTQIENEIALIGAKLRSRSSSCLNVGKLSAESKTTQEEGLPEVDFLQLYCSDERGSDLRTDKELEVGSLVFQQEAYAAIVLKPNRDTHCHFCFEALPSDPVACYGCAIPIYCSNLCRFHAAAGYQTLSLGLDGIHGPEEIKSKSSASAWKGEHTHECGGFAWPAVLPTDAVLATRILFRSSLTPKHMENKTSQISEDRERRMEGKAEKLCILRRTLTVDTLCSNYERLSSNDKLEIHVLGVVLAHCVQRSITPYMDGGSKVAGKVASKLVQLIAQTRVNAMAIYCMSSPDPAINSANTVTNPTINTAFCTVEQVQVAQGLYLLGSSLNHSCVPNVHASFKSRRLFVYSISSIPAGSSLELCYGPQVGHMSQLERKQILLERYYFTCRCSACARVTSSDLFLRSVRCVKQGCMGVVLSPDLNGLHSSFSGTSSHASCSSSTGRSSSEFSGIPSIGGHKVSREISEKDFQSGCTDTSLQEHAVPDVISIGIEISRRLTCKDMIGRCLECGTPVDVESAHEVANKTLSRLERMESEVLAPEATSSSRRRSLKGALDALDKLRMVLHAYNEQLAKGEDIIARLFCALDQPLDGLKHCEKAIQILERLYNKHHIVLGNEYLKLASIALIVPDLERARRSLRSADYIFRIHYGYDYRQRVPYIAELCQRAHQE